MKRLDMFLGGSDYLYSVNSLSHKSFANFVFFSCVNANLCFISCRLDLHQSGRFLLQISDFYVALLDQVSALYFLMCII